MTDEAAEQFEKIIPKIKEVASDWQYYFWPALFGFIIGLIIGLVVGSIDDSKKTPMFQLCLATCGQGQVAKFSDIECECKEGDK